MGFGASVGPSVFHLLSNLMRHVTPSVRGPKEILCSFTLAMFSPYTIHKVSKNDLFEQGIPICREMKEKYYYKGIGIIV